MTDYEQPNFYRFSEDSIKLSALAKKYCRKRSYLRVLDLGAGSGVVGLELVSKLDSEVHVAFCESQEDYLPMLESNCKKLALKKTSFTYEILNCDWNQITERDFDLIVSNPPYFLKSDGRASSDPRTNTARRWSKDEEEGFFKTCLMLAHAETVMIFSLRRDVPDFFKSKTNVLACEVFNERSDVLTEGIVFRLNIETDKRFQ